MTDRTAVRLRSNELLWIEYLARPNRAPQGSHITRDVIGLLVFAALTVVLLVVWVVGFWDGIVIPDRPSTTEASSSL